MMLPLPSDVPPTPLLSTSVTTYSRHDAAWPEKPWCSDLPSVRYEASSALTTAQQNLSLRNESRYALMLMAEKNLSEDWLRHEEDKAWAHLQDAVVTADPPKTELGKKLLALRRAYLASGGKLLTADELDKELSLRRGGLSDA